MERLLIVGCGPVGLSLGVGLVRKGVPVTLIDKQPEIPTFPKASTIHAPTLEIFQEWGVLDKLLPIGLIADRVQYWDRTSGQMIAEFNLRQLKDYTPYPFRLHLDQYFVSKALLEYLQGEPLADVRFETELVDLKQDEAGVEATFRSSRGEETVRYPFVIGADGISSTVRKLLNIPYTGYSNPHYHLMTGLVDYEIQERFSKMSSVAMFLHPTDWVDIIGNVDFLKVIVPLPEEQIDRVDEDFVRAKMKEIDIVKEGFGIRYHTVYKTHQLVADRMVSGRVVIIGDAAHVNAEFGGMGMNSGIHDAYLLVDHLYSALKEGGYQEHLQAFEQKRLHVTKEAVQKATIGNTELIQNNKQRQENLKRIAADPQAAIQYMLRITMIEGFRFMTPAR